MGLQGVGLRWELQGAELGPSKETTPVLEAGRLRHAVLEVSLSLKSPLNYVIVWPQQEQRSEH